MVLKFYYSTISPPSQAVWMVLKELGLKFTLHFVDLLADEPNKGTYAAVNKYKVVPAIVDVGVTLSESRAIAIYLCNKYEPKDKAEKLYPTSGAIEMANSNRIMFRDIDNYQTVLKYLNGDEIFAGKACGPREDLYSKATTVLEETEEMLSRNQYIFGSHLTLLDFFILSTVSCMEVIDTDWKNFPAIGKWRRNMAKLPYYEECHEKGVKEYRVIYKDVSEKSANKK